MFLALINEGSCGRRVIGTSFDVKCKVLICTGPVNSVAVPATSPCLLIDVSLTISGLKFVGMLIWLVLADPFINLFFV